MPGTLGRDKITGGVTTLSSTDTLQASDQIDGGGGRDTADIAINKNFGGFTVGTGFMKNVETVNLTNTTTTNVTFTARAVEGVETYNVKGPVSVSGIASLATRVNLSDMTALADTTAVTVQYADEIVSGSSDKATIGIGGLGRPGTAASPFGAPFAGVNVTVPGIETVTLDSSSANYVRVVGAQMTGLTLTGSGAFVMADVPATLKTFDGSAATGAQTVAFDSATGMTSIKTGSANDSIRLNAVGDFRADATIDGGAGTDTLVVNNAVAHTASAFTLKDVETISITGGGNAITMAPASATGLKTISIGATMTGGAHSITGLGAIPITLDIRAATATATSTDRTTVENTAAATLNISAGTATTNQTSSQSATFSRATSLDVTLAEFTTLSTGDVVAPRATKVSLSGKGTFDHANDGLVLAAAESLTIDQQSIGTWNVGVSKTTDVTQANAPLKDLTITAKGTVALTTVNNTTDNAFSNLERLTVTTDTAFNPSAGAFATLGNATSVVLAGSQNASQVTLGILGANTNAYGLSLKATGLKGGLQTGNLLVGSGQAISVDITGKQNITAATNTTTIGALTVGAAAPTAAAPGTGSITINGASATDAGALSISTGGASYAKSITVDLTGSAFGTTGGVNIGGGQTFTADTMSIKTPTAPASATVPDTIAVKDSLTLHGPATVSLNGAGAVAISAAEGSTALTIDLLGSLADDVFTVTSTRSTQTSIKVTGDLKGGTDRVDITSASVASTGGQTIDVSGLLNATTSIIGSAGKDTIIGSAGNDTIQGSGGADTINLSSGGTDVVFFRSPVQDMGAVTELISSAGVRSSLSSTSTFSANARIETGSLDKIIGFGVGDTIRTNSLPNGTDVAANTTIQTLNAARGTGTTLSNVAATATSDGAGSIDLFVRGTYSESAQTFTFTNNGADTLYLVDDNGTAGGTTMYGIVLVGYVLGAANGPTATTGLVGAALAG